MNGNLVVPFLDLKAQYPLIREEIEDKLRQIISNAAFILGEHVEEFEQNFARAHNAKYCVALSSGTAALHVAMQVLEIGPGDEVIVPANTFIATAEAVSLVGARPVFVDCDEYYNIDVQAVETKLEQDRRQNANRKIKAVVPVHLYGQPADMSTLCELAERFDVRVIEDAAQAHLATWEGETVGNFGNIAAFSFYPGKNLGAFGEAGAIVTNDEALYQHARMYRQHGEIRRYHHAIAGHNYRMEAIQGAVLTTKLKHLELWTQRRQANAHLYSELLRGVEGITVPKCRAEANSVYHLYVIQARDREALRQHLDAHGIGTGLHYPTPLHRQPAYAQLASGERHPVAEESASRILSLPMYAELTEQQIVHVCEAIKAHVQQPSLATTGRV